MSDMSQSRMSRTSGIDFYTIVRAVANEVMYQTQAVTWLMVERNREIVGSVSEMDDRKRENWLVNSAWPTYAECSMMIEYLEPHITYAENKIKEYLKVKNFRKVDEYKGDLVTLAESYFYWAALQRRAKDVYDQTWRYGIVQPIPDFDLTGKEKRPHIITMIQDMAGKLQRGTEGAVKKIEKDAQPTQGAPIDQEFFVPRVVDPRVRAWDLMAPEKRAFHTGEEKKEQEEASKDGKPKDSDTDSGNS